MENFRKKRSTRGLFIVIFAVFTFFLFWIFVVSPIMSKVMNLHYRRPSYIANIERLGDITKRRLDSYDIIPEHLKWCDILEEDDNISMATFRLPEYWQEENIACYALNKYVIGKKVAEIHPKTVFLFESQPGWNQVGDWNLLDSSYHENKGCCIYFYDGNAEFIKKEDFEKLKWK